MRKVLLAGVLLLSACGGGGSTPAPPTPTPVPIANTSLSYYLPLASGNTWTFATGGKFVDLGSSTLTCTCPASGVAMEQIGLYAPGASTISGSLFFTKTAPSGQFGPLTNMLGVENDANTNNITIMSDTAYPNGFPVMDDNPSANEFWSDNGAQSTITAVGGTMFLPSGAKIINIATDQLTSTSETITLAFAKGVGFTSVGVGAQSTSITSFFVNTTTSKSGARDSVGAPRRFYGTMRRGDVSSVLGKIF